MPNKLAPHAQPLLLVGLVCALAAVGLTAAAVGTNHWYGIDINGAYTHAGLFKTCPAHGDCMNHQYNDLDTKCTRSAGEQQRRMRAVQATVLIGLAFEFFALVIAAIVKTQDPARIVRTVLVCCSVVGFLSLGTGAVLYIYIQENWLYCDAKFCEYYESLSVAAVDCSSKIKYSYILVIVALGLSFLELIFFVAFSAFAPPPKPRIRMPKTKSPTEEEKGDAPRAAEDTQAEEKEPDSPQNPARTEAARPAAIDTEEGGAMEQQSGEDAIPPPPEGDWTYDKESGMYWSDNLYLFLHPHSSQFYDPKSGMWYNPDTDQWYNPE